MSGIKINLKKKKQPRKINENKNENIQHIESYSIEKPKPKKLVITPTKINKTIKQEEVKYGVTEFEKTKSKATSVIKQQDESDPEEDEEQVIPVEEFGLAFLRGLGYNEEEVEVEKPRLEHRKKGPTLGIGAKSLDHNT